MPREKLFDERYISQQPAIEVLQGLGYETINPIKAEAMRGNLYEVLLKTVLEQKLRKLNSYEYKGVSYQFSETNIQQAIRDLEEALTDGLVKTNEKIFETLLLGRSYTEFLPDGSKKSFTIQFVDWYNVEKNDFHVVEEFSIVRQDGKGTIRPDIVLFVNGIPFGVIECKRLLFPCNKALAK
ncbi:type I restriction endonuclease [Bacillus sp. N9]